MGACRASSTPSPAGSSRSCGATCPLDDIPAHAGCADRGATGPPRRVRPKDVRRAHEEPISNVHGFPVFTLWRPGAEDRRPDGRALPARRRLRAARRRPALAVRDPAGRRARTRARCCRRYPLAPEFTVEDSFEEMVELFEEVARRVTRGRGAGRRLRRRWLRAGARRGAARPRWGPAGPARADRALGRPHRHHAGHPRGGRARPLALLPAPADLRLLLGRDRRPGQARRRRGSAPVSATSPGCHRR